MIGCGSPRPYDVRAVVTLDGNPLAEAEVFLFPVQEKDATAVGVTDTEGNVAFQTADADGVFPGSYIVVVSKIIEEKTLSNNEIRALAESGIRYRPNMIELVPKRYTRRESSDLKATVGYWRSKNWTFDLRSE